MTSVDKELQEVDFENTSKQLKTIIPTTSNIIQSSNKAELDDLENREGLEPNLIKKRKINDIQNDLRSKAQNRIRDINPESILEHLRNIATYGEKCQLNDESEKALEQILEYKQNAQGLVINEELFQASKEGHELTPAIFTKKTNVTARMSKNMHTWMIGFENYLSMVAQLYYKKNFNIREILMIPGENRDTVVQNSLNLSSNGEKKKRGRKNTSKASTNQKENFSSSTNDESSSKKPASGNQNNSNHHGRRGRPSANQEEKKNEQQQYNFSKEEIQLSILDQLINPLKTDYPFELWSPKEIAIFECAMCKFGKQFGFISALIGTKTHRDVFEFYLMWKGTSHYKIWKMHKNIGNRNNHSHLI
ncbi:MYB DNA-binding protein/transcription factor-like protein, putative (macronuclear) [Tetrahymena thermophila SB210]|uniref:MYB DNA-binding protein/transcription factor-like protein, putative n=1 Tax=Tetrahymena thermophila (strain SB210) TaxID=312017 RepID=Q23FA3_TETTS|nr:MYB DNA-binding protein/transcription factor-like protein, putative [Tetrahymena thermophila SB210]EAR95250.2 MYB DNA-binding protein/transcription factor-like protein, putative [Tetrahymena thermophila SB210]|eukprot:XP_001015495.2 MYB DNA-binding protein/transcription factor-like protein, putative [Tetrahymena thermophila SB210]